ncbi:TPA: tryptophan synthase subunit alpha [Candidatus Bathyarchaeota archaeon]|nr:tryptophan synthase subunit alpha [Candidatus Bathyarchaeota archaeon]
MEETPIVALTYYNLIYRMGVERFVKLAKECGVDGVVVADLPIEESGEYRSEAQKYGLDTVFLAAPSTTSERLRRIAERSSGFLYLVSVFGVTGIREKLQELTVKLIRRAASVVGGRLPLSVGFGISKPEHVSSVISKGADGAIVGSKFVKIIGENRNAARMLEELEGEALKLKRATLKGEVKG